MPPSQRRAMVTIRVWTGGYVLLGVSHTGTSLTRRFLQHLFVFVFILEAFVRSGQVRSTTLLTTFHAGLRCHTDARCGLRLRSVRSLSSTPSPSRTWARAKSTRHMMA